MNFKDRRRNAPVSLGKLGNREIPELLEGQNRPVFQRQGVQEEGVVLEIPRIDLAEKRHDPGHRVGRGLERLALESLDQLE